MPPPLKIKPTDRFGKLTVIRYFGKTGIYNTYECLCDCGKIKVAKANSLLNGGTKSCGCLRNIARKRIKHGYCRKGVDSNEYRIWHGIIERCCNPKNKAYLGYGARGITVCDRWRNDFPAFLSDMGERPSKRHSVERNNNDGIYEPNNCYWGTPKIQSNNTRRNRFLIYNGESKTISQWSDITGLSRKVIGDRINKWGYSVEEALNKPAIRGGYKMGIIKRFASYSLEGGILLKEYTTIREVANDGFSPSSVHLLLNGKKKKQEHKGLAWKYLSNEVV